MLDWQVSLGNVITIVGVILSLFFHAISQAVIITRKSSLVEGKIDRLDERMERMEKNENLLTEVIIKVAESRTEIKLLADRITDVQLHGSHRLAEMLADVKRDYEKCR